VNVDELGPGLWRWTASHPDWKPDDGGPGGWDQEVACVYFEAPGAVVLIDPQVPADDSDDAARFRAALDRDVREAARPVVVLLTCDWHERSADKLVRRYDATVRRRTDPASLPEGVVGVDVPSAQETLFWIPAHRALFSGDVLVGAHGGVRLSGWLDEGVDRAEHRASLRTLLDLPIELVLTGHGEPVLKDGKAAVAEAIEAPFWYDERPRGG
jgi:glyoxylase-like metal-dependent hydrolase (beta-lactamase superfamily II)